MRGQVWLLFLASLVTAVSSDAASDLAARLAAKRMAMEAQLRASQEAQAAAAAREREAAEAAAAELSWARTVRDGNGTEVGEFRYPGAGGLEEHPADTALAFAVEKGLPPMLRRALASEACAALPMRCGGRNRAAVATLPVEASPGEVVGTIELFDGDEAADAALAFVRSRNLPEAARHQLHAALCAQWPASAVACSRDHAVVFARPAGWGGLPDALSVAEGQEAADAVFALVVTAHGGKLEDYRRITDHICMPWAHIEEAGGEAAALGEAARPFLKCTRRRVVVQKMPVANGDSHGGLLGEVPDSLNDCCH